MHYYEFNIGDYMRDTAHLDDMEDLAYRRMLDLYYLKESPLPPSIPEIAKLIRMRTHSESIANVLREYFTLTDDGYVNAKANSTLSKIYGKSEKAKKSAEIRWEKQRLKNANALQTDSERNANGMLPNNLTTQQPNNTDPLVDSVEPTAAKDDFVSEQFARFWRNYPLKKSKVATERAFRNLVKGKKESQVIFWVDLIINYHLDCVEREKAGSVEDKGSMALHASTLINQKRWQDDPDYFDNFKAEWIKENGQD